MANELAVTSGKLDVVEMPANKFHPPRISDCQYKRCQLLGPKVEMVNGTTVVQNEFRFRYTLHKSLTDLIKGWRICISAG